MAQQTINIGTVGDDGTGDDLRTAGGKINDNFTELYARNMAVHVKTNNLTVADNTVIAGSSFTPPLTREPAYIIAYDSGQEIEGLVKSYAQNGSYYDITIFSTEAFTNAKIKVIA